MISLSPSGRVAEQHKCFVLAVLGSNLKCPLETPTVALCFLRHTHKLVTFKVIGAVNEHYYSFFFWNVMHAVRLVVIDVSEELG